MNKRWKLYPYGRPKNIRLLPFVVAVAPIALYLGLGEFGSKSIEDWEIWVIAIVTAVGAGFVTLIMRTVTRNEKTELELNYDQGVAVFRNYAFASKFVGDKAQAEVVLPFTAIFRTKLLLSRGSRFFEIFTEKGIVTVVGYANQIEIEEAFTQIADSNRRENPEYAKEFSTMARPRTPWYGWVLAAAALALIGYVWWFALKDT